MIGNGKTGANKKGKIDVFINDQTNPLFQYYLIDELKTDITLTSDAAKNAETVNVSSGHGFVAGNIITMFYGGRYSQQIVKSVALDAITISYPLASAFPASGTIVYRGDRNINKNAASTPINYLMTLKNISNSIDISKIVLNMSHAQAGDDGKFGGIAALTNGMWFRKENEVDFNLGNYLNNADFRSVGAEITYAAKGPGGTESTVIVFDLIKIFGQVIRIDDRLNDVFCSQIRDDLSGLGSFTISLIGSYTDES